LIRQNQSSSPPALAVPTTKINSKKKKGESKIPLRENKTKASPAKSAENKSTHVTESLQDFQQQQQQQTSGNNGEGLDTNHIQTIEEDSNDIGLLFVSLQFHNSLRSVRFQLKLVISYRNLIY